MLAVCIPFTHLVMPLVLLFYCCVINCLFWVNSRMLNESSAIFFYMCPHDGSSRRSDRVYSCQRTTLSLTDHMEVLNSLSLHTPHRSYTLPSLTLPLLGAICELPSPQPVGWQTLPCTHPIYASGQFMTGLQFQVAFASISRQRSRQLHPKVHAHCLYKTIETKCSA